MITAKQLVCLKAIRRLSAGGVCPSYRQIVREIGASSTNHVWQYIKQLTERGYISRIETFPRALVLTDKAAAILPHVEILRFDDKTQTLEPLEAR